MRQFAAFCLQEERSRYRQEGKGDQATPFKKAVRNEQELSQGHSREKAYCNVEQALGKRARNQHGAKEAFSQTSVLPVLISKEGSVRYLIKWMTK